MHGVTFYISNTLRKLMSRAYRDACLGKSVKVWLRERKRKLIEVKD